MLVFVVGVFFAPSSVVAQTAGGTAADTDAGNAQAWKDCNDWASSRGYGPCWWRPPHDGNPYGDACAGNYPNGEICNGLAGPYQPTQTAPPCSSLANSTSWVSGEVLNGYYTSVADAQGNMCRVNLVPVTPPMHCGTGWCTLVEYSPTDNGPDTSPASPAGSVDNGSGQPAQPTVPNYPASGSSAPSGSAPDICGGGSCYDPNTGNACYLDAGGQHCMQMPTGGSQQGGCISSGSTTMCTGVVAPSPVGSQGSTITDPATQIQSSDTYTSANSSTGAVGSTTVNVYSSGGSTSSGATSGSVSGSKGSSSTVSGKSGPASGSSSGGNGDSWGGGGDCNTPPVCQGDAVMCGVTLEQWRTMCSAHTDTTTLTKYFAGDGSSPPTFQQDQSKYSQSDVTVQPSTGNTVGDAANSGSYDATGFGFSTSCPAHDLSVSIGPFGSFTVPFSLICPIGPWIYALVVGFALYRAACVTAGSSF